MHQPPRKPQTGRVPQGKAAPKAGPPTRRGATAPAAPAKNTTTMMLAIGGGAVAVVIILFIALSGGDDHRPAKAKEKESAPASAKKAPLPDVSGLEATGKSKCEDGQRLIQPRLNPDPQAPKDRVFKDLEAGIKLMNEGLEAYKKATGLAGKKYPTDEYQRTRDRAIKVFCTALEAEGQSSCEAGLKIIKSTQPRIVDTNSLSDAERASLYTELKKATDMIRSGMELLSRSEGVSGRTFDVTHYTEALKVARHKLPELKPN
jgi:hypothetical protein